MTLVASLTLALTATGVIIASGLLVGFLHEFGFRLYQILRGHPEEPRVSRGRFPL